MPQMQIEPEAPETRMERIYLFVPPEEYAEVEACGACWDDTSKSWYIPSDREAAPFARWSGEAGDTEFAIISDQALVASAFTACVSCHERIEVICLYCESGTDCAMDQPMTQFTVSNIGAMDGALASQLERWRFFRKVSGEGAEDGCFANHCPHCGAVQEDYLLHAEPGDVFFCIPQAQPGSITFTPLSGRIQVSGNWGWVV
jgi:hypothetical protein